MKALKTLAAMACMALSLAAGGAQAGDVLDEVVAGDWRKPEDRARDAWRDPAESLRFWGLAPGMNILEVQPGGGWWSDILGPYARRTGGRYFATGPDLADPALSERGRQARADMEASYASRKELYGEVAIVNWGRQSAPPAAGQFDLALVARSFHGWMRTEGYVQKALGDLFTALKPGKRTMILPSPRR